MGMGGSVVSHVNLTGVRAVDGGAYTCTAANRAGSTAHTARLNVYGEYWLGCESSEGEKNECESANGKDTACCSLGVKGKNKHMLSNMS